MSDQKQFEVLQWASLFLEKQGREVKVAEYLLQHHLDISRSKFFMNMQEVVPASVVDKMKRDIKQHADTGIPLQHLIGYEIFYDRRFKVNKHVLIPRPETEELILHVIQAVNKKHAIPLRVVDVGTGSGVIAVTLARELNAVEVTATDISQEALEVAKENANTHEADVEFLRGDFLEPLVEKGRSVDIIVSNPPYIAEVERETLEDTVRDFDPDIALFAVDNGLHAYKTIIKQAEQVLTEQGILAFEIGHTQGEAVKAYIKESFPHKTVDIFKDINGKDRVVLAMPTIE